MIWGDEEQSAYSLSSLLFILFCFKSNFEICYSWSLPWVFIVFLCTYFFLFIHYSLYKDIRNWLRSSPYSNKYHLNWLLQYIYFYIKIIRVRASAKGFFEGHHLSHQTNLVMFVYSFLHEDTFEVCS